MHPCQHPHPSLPHLPVSWSKAHSEVPLVMYEILLQFVESVGRRTAGAGLTAWYPTWQGNSTFVRNLSTGFQSFLATVLMNASVCFCCHWVKVALLARKYPQWADTVSLKVDKNTSQVFRSLDVYIQKGTFFVCVFFSTVHCWFSFLDVDWCFRLVFCSVCWLALCCVCRPYWCSGTWCVLTVLRTLSSSPATPTSAKTSPSTTFCELSTQQAQCARGLAGFCWGTCKQTWLPVNVVYLPVPTLTMRTRRSCCSSCWPLGHAVWCSTVPTRSHCLCGADWKIHHLSLCNADQIKLFV